MSNVNKVPISRLAAVQNNIVIHSYAKVQKKDLSKLKLNQLEEARMWKAMFL